MTLYAIIPRARPEDPGMAGLWDFIERKYAQEGETRFLHPLELRAVHRDWERAIKVMMQRGYVEFRRATDSESRALGSRSQWPSDP